MAVNGTHDAESYESICEQDTLCAMSASICAAAAPAAAVAASIVVGDDDVDDDDDADGLIASDGADRGRLAANVVFLRLSEQPVQQNTLDICHTRDGHASREKRLNAVMSSKRPHAPTNTIRPPARTDASTHKRTCTDTNKHTRTCTHKQKQSHTGDRSVSTNNVADAMRKRRRRNVANQTTYGFPVDKPL